MSSIATGHSRLPRLRALACGAWLLLLALAACAAPPATLRVVDLRWIAGQPELETWLGSLQGTLNRQDGDSAVFVVGEENDAAWAETLVRMYHLKREVLTPGALLEAAKPTLTGQVLYDPAQPWTRNLALYLAAIAPGAVIASDHDLGVPTVEDLRTKWTNREEAMQWVVAQYSKDAKPPVIFAPESGHLLADLIAARKALAVDPSQLAGFQEEFFRLLPGNTPLLGSADSTPEEAESAMWKLTQQLLPGGQPLIPARDTGNLSCFARFAASRPLVQGRNEAAPGDTDKVLVLVYDGGSAMLDGSQSLRYAARDLYALLQDPALAVLPVGIELPLPLLDTAPAIYQALLARQRFTAAEFLAAPNGAGWTLPSALKDNAGYLARSAALAKQMDITGVTLFDAGDDAAYGTLLASLAQAGWRGAIVRPFDPRTPRTDRTLPGFSALVAAGRVGSVHELREALKVMPGPFQVLFLDPRGLPPAALAPLLPEIRATHTLVTPSQAFRAKEEYEAITPWLKARLDAGERAPKRGKPTLTVASPTTDVVKPTAADAIPVRVRISGEAGVLTARLIYGAPNGRVGAADLRETGNGVWSAVLPPMLVGGTLSVRARVVEKGQFGTTISEPLTLTITSADADTDTLDDTLEAYLGSDPQVQDTDADGLPDGIDPDPIFVDRHIPRLLPPLEPPADGPFLAEAGKSTASRETGRVLPAGTSVTYRLPLKDVPAAPALVQMLADGAGTVTLNTGAPVTLEKGDGPAFTDLPTSAAQMSGKELTVKLTAGEQPLHLLALELMSNGNGPYFLSTTIDPPHPPSGVPVTVQATVYDPDGVKTVRVRYGTAAGALKTLELKPVERSGNVIFTGELPKTSPYTALIYGIEAEDTKGNVAATPYRAEPVGRTRKHSVALLGTRDLRGTWLPSPLWNGAGRVSVDGAAQDKHVLLVRPGKYYVWLLAQPRERGITFTAARRLIFAGDKMEVRFTGNIPAGSADGWYKLGTVTAEEGMRLHLNVSPVGEKGYCAYGEVIFTQDDQFTPPLAIAPLDWYNTLTLVGADDGQTFTGTINLSVLPTGNLDVIEVTAEQVRGAVMINPKTYNFAKKADGTYTLDTRGFLPGVYLIKAVGYRIVTEDGKTSKDALVTVTARVNVEAK